MSGTGDDCILHIEKVSKSYQGIKALDEVCLRVQRGEVHALMGENGAGKSTLMKILTGIIKKDSGTIYIDGHSTDIKDPKTALNLGIAMIHQELNPIENMTVAENIFLGKEPCYGRTGIINRRALKKEVRSLFDELEIKIDPGVKTGTLSVAELQLVEIVKAVSYNARIIIMDEPTSAITHKEVEKLFGIIETLKQRGVAVIYISHKMEEIMKISDTVTVLRDGRYIATKAAKDVNEQSLVALMVGREQKLFSKQAKAAGAVALEVDQLGKKGLFTNISFKAHRGETVGFAGLMGAGRTEIMETLFGLRHHDAGEIKVNGIKTVIRTAVDAVKHRLALVSEDRKLKGLNLKGSVKENITLSSLQNCCRAGGVIDRKKEAAIADAQMQKLNIKASGKGQIVGTLSGGNQQKVVLSKWLLTGPDILILDEPTRGIDISAKQEIYKIISGLAGEGKCIILVSSEMPELLALCDKIIVLNRGAISDSFSREQFDAEAIMAAMSQPSDQS